MRGHNRRSANVAVCLKVRQPKDEPEFEVAFQNMGEQDVSLNLGIMLANGKVQLPRQNSSQPYEWKRKKAGTPLFRSTRRRPRGCLCGPASGGFQLHHLKCGWTSSGHQAPEEFES